MLRVIIADDENLICQMIVKVVDWEGLGMNVCGIAHDGLTVLRLIQTEKPDIVITDIRMPGIDGLDMIRKAEAIDEHVRFLIISGYRSFDYAHMAINLGVSHYLLKPIDHVELEDTLKQLYYEITVMK
ncbi:MAG: response regulator [Bilifractor sp.]